MGNEAAASKTGGTNRQPFRIGSWRVEPDLNRLVQAQRTEVVEPRLMRLLVFLAARPGTLALKEDIIAAVWDGLPATDESLSQAISKLRKILGKDAQTPRYIETISKKGYRLLADVEPVLDVHRRTPGTKLLPGSFVALAAIGIFYFLSQPKVPPPADAFLDAHPITSAPGRERDPNISSDGSYVVYSAPGDGGSEQIFLHGIGRGTEDRQLTRRGNNRAPVFMPGGNAVAFLRRHDAECAVLLVTLIDGAERVLGECTGNDYSDTAAAASGRWLAFNAREHASDTHAIYLLDADTGRRRALTMPPAGIWGDYDPAFTADGRSVVFARSISEGMQDLYVVEIETGRERQLTASGRNIMGVALLDGRIIYGTNSNGRYRIWSIGLDGEDLLQLPIASSGILNPSAAADGSRLVFESIDRAVSLQEIDTGNTDGARTLLSFNADILHPDVSAVSKRIVFSSNRSGFYEIWDADESGNDIRRLTDFSAGFTAHPKFSADGSRIAFDARPGSEARIYVMNRDGSNLAPVSAAGKNAYAPSWSADGRALYYSAETGDSLQIWRTDIASGNAQQVTVEGGLYGVAGVDGDLYHVRPREDGIWRLGADRNSPPERVLDVPGIADWGNWTLRNGRILYYDRQRSALRSYDIGSGATVDLAEVEGTVPPADPSVAFGYAGGRAYLGIRTRLDSDLEIVGRDPVATH